MNNGLRLWAQVPQWTQVPLLKKDLRDVAGRNEIIQNLTKLNKAPTSFLFNKNLFAS